MSVQLPCIGLEGLESRLFLNAPGWSDSITNAYFPLLPGSTYVYTGTKEADRQLDRMIVTNLTKQILGVSTTVVFDRVFINGVLEEKTYDWYAQDNAGNVWYFGEDTRELDASGKVTSREGSWQAGVNGAKAGIIMQARPGLGDSYFQEFAAGVAEDHAVNVSFAGRAKNDVGTFTNCLVTHETTPLDPTALDEKVYAPGIGSIKENSLAGPVETLKLKSFELGPAGFGTVIDNPYLPMLPGSIAVYKGTKSGDRVTNRVIVTDLTKAIQGVTTTVVFDRVFVNGVLEEKTYDWYAQDKAGNVWYFGEDTRELDASGKVVSREGSWQAGVNSAKAGIVMQAVPGVGNTYRQEFAAGVAEDQASVIGLRTRADVPYGSFRNCLETLEFTALEPTVQEHKFYVAGIGLVKSQSVSGESEIMKLVEYSA